MLMPSALRGFVLDLPFVYRAGVTWKVLRRLKSSQQLAAVDLLVDRMLDAAAGERTPQLARSTSLRWCAEQLVTANEYLEQIVHLRTPSVVENGGKVCSKCMRWQRFEESENVLVVHVELPGHLQSAWLPRFVKIAGEGAGDVVDILYAAIGDRNDIRAN